MEQKYGVTDTIKEEQGEDLEIENLEFQTPNKQVLDELKCAQD